MAIVAARSSYMRDHPDTKLEDLVIHASTQAHSLGSKAGLVLGIQVLAIEVSYDDELMLRALEEDLKLGLSLSFLVTFFIVRVHFTLLTFYVHQLQLLEPPLLVQSTTRLR